MIYFCVLYTQKIKITFMKKFNLFFLCLFVTSSIFAQTVFNGNTKSGFGGAVGNGSLSITDDATNINFTFTKGTSGDFDNALVIYVDTKTGGFSSTASSTDNGDNLRKATSGYSTPTDKSVLTFPVGFAPDYAISIDFGYAAIFSLVAGGVNSLVYIGSGNILPANATKTTPVLTFIVPKGQIGITTNASLKFLAACISETAYRSNEYIGDAGPVANSAYTDYTATTFNTYNFTVVLPISLQYFNGVLKNNGIVLTWKTSSEINANNFEIEKLSRGNFVKIGSVAASNNSGSNIYSFTDNANVTSTYRLKSIDKDGAYKYSSAITVNASITTLNSVKLYPTIINDNAVTINFNQQGLGKAIIKVLSVNGNILQQQVLDISAGATSLRQQLPSLQKGTYIVNITTNEEQKSFTIIVQ